jgi:hypothetical protein
MYFPDPQGLSARGDASRRRAASIVDLISLPGMSKAVSNKGASATNHEAAVPRQLAVRSGMLSGMRAQGADA